MTDDQMDELRELQATLRRLRPNLGTLEAMRDVAARIVPTGSAQVTLFRPSGKYYTDEWWKIPDGAMLPYDMRRSDDFRRIEGGPVLVHTQHPWGYPLLFPVEPTEGTY